MKLTNKQKELAHKLLKQFKKKKIYVNAKSDHMYFSKGNAKAGLCDEDFEEIVVEVTAGTEATSNAQVSELPEGLPNEDWTNDQLKDYCEQHSIEYRKSWTKDELLKAIEESSTPEATE